MAGNGNNAPCFSGILIGLKNDLLLALIYRFHLHQVYDKCPMTPEQPGVLSLNIFQIAVKLKSSVFGNQTDFVGNTGCFKVINAGEGNLKFRKFIVEYKPIIDIQHRLSLMGNSKNVSYLFSISS